ncbi:MAG TPA: glucokinase [Vicinamibacterales bacterium]|nr:glucokinase [Vicinamibacterales bacterium]
MLLAGDVGGTKTLLGLFERAYPRPIPHAIESYATGSFQSFLDILRTFTRETPRGREVEAVTLGVAGPVSANRARLTNVDLEVVGDEIAFEVGTPRVRILNDLAALAISVPILTTDELLTLQEGRPLASGNAAVIAAGTGLGEAFLHHVDGRWIPLSTEAGHADFAARTDREMELVRMLRNLYGRAGVEHVLSGPGLINLHRFTHRGGECAVIDAIEAGLTPAQVSQGAMSGRCQSCVDALRMFVSAYGAEAGNLALRGVTTSGLFVGGGIARKILPFVQEGKFMEAFLAKGPMSDLMLTIPVRVILNEQAGLIGAAAYAQSLHNL